MNPVLDEVAQALTRGSDFVQELTARAGFQVPAFPVEFGLQYSNPLGANIFLNRIQRVFRSPCVSADVVRYGVRLRPNFLGDEDGRVGRRFENGEIPEIKNRVKQRVLDQVLAELPAVAGPEKLVRRDEDEKPAVAEDLHSTGVKIDVKIGGGVVNLWENGL